METRAYPIWREAAEKISEKVERDGYGFLITWDEMAQLLELRERRVGQTPQEMDAIEFERMDRIVNLSQALLLDHHIFIKNERNKGYRVLEPDRQVSDGWAHEYGKVKKHLRRALAVLYHVDMDRLSKFGLSERDRNLSKTVFVLQATKKQRALEQ